MYDFNEGTKRGVLHGAFQGALYEQLQGWIQEVLKGTLQQAVYKLSTLKAFKKRFRRIISAISYQHPSNGGVVQVQSLTCRNTNTWEKGSLVTSYI